jgi:hypothetical protein
MFGNWKLVIGICLVIVSWLLVMVPAGAVPQTINFQGILKDSAGKPINGTVNLTFSIYDSVSGGTARWSEVQNGVTVETGIYSVQLGSVNSIDYSIFDGSTKYLGVKVGDEELTPRLPMISVPYAFRAASADVATNANYATLSGTASSAAYVKGQVSAEASGNDYALFVNGRLGASAGASGCVGTGTLTSPQAETGWIYGPITSSSVILVSVGNGSSANPGGANERALAVTAVDPTNSRFKIGTIDGSTLHDGIPYSYLIIN